MAHKQKKLIAAAVYSLKPGGSLIYSTCTFSPEENEEIIDWILNKFKEELKLLPIDVPFNNVIKGFTSWGQKKFSETLKLARRIIPNEFMEGFFIAKLQKSQ